MKKQGRKFKPKEEHYSRAYAVRFAPELVDFVNAQPNFSKFISGLVRREMERQKLQETCKDQNHEP